MHSMYKFRDMDKNKVNQTLYLLYLSFFCIGGQCSFYVQRIQIHCGCNWSIKMGMKDEVYKVSFGI